MAEYNSPSHCDLRGFAPFPQSSFRHYFTYANFFAQNYVNDVRTIAGLGFVAMLVDHEMAFSDEHHLHCVMNCSQGDFRSYPSALVDLTSAFIEMIRLSTIHFITLKHPAYYPCFLNEVKKTFAKIIVATPIAQLRIRS